MHTFAFRFFQLALLVLYRRSGAPTSSNLSISVSLPMHDEGFSRVWRRAYRGHPRQRHKTFVRLITGTTDVDYVSRDALMTCTRHVCLSEKASTSYRL